jgi:hypothetical protein
VTLLSKQRAQPIQPYMIGTLPLGRRW